MTENPSSEQAVVPEQASVADETPAPERASRFPAAVRWALIVLSVLVAVVLLLVVYVIATESIPEILILVSGVISNNGLYLLPLGLIGLGLAFVAYRAEARRVGTVTGVIALVATVAICFPLVASWRAADRYGTDLSVGDYLDGGKNEGKPVEALSVVYNEVGGQQLKLDAKVPPGTPAKPRPAVVWVHGGGWNVGDRGEVPLWHKWLNDKGYAVFAIDYRLAPPTRWDQAPADVKCAIGWVKSHAQRYQVDPDRVMIAGGSAGGNLTLMGAYSDERVKPSCEVQDTSVKAAMAFYPAVSLNITWDQSGFQSQVRPWIRNYTGGSPQEVPQHYTFASADTYVRPGLPPTLLMHGDRDHIAPYAGSVMLADKLRQAGVKHELVTIPYAEHIFDFAWNTWGTQICRQAMERFLMENFPV